MHDRPFPSQPRKAPILVLGGGLAGLSAALHSAHAETHLLERREGVGGHARSCREAGHVFDQTGHWLHLRDPQSFAWIQALDPQLEWMQVERRAEVYCSGRHLPYPFQLNLHALSKAQRRRCLDALPEAIAEPSTAKDFDAYVVERFGQGMAELFFRPYNEKLWGCALSALRPDCMSRFLPRPQLSEIRAGAKGPLSTPAGYNASFYYPKKGGIDHLPKALAQRIAQDSGKAIHCGQDVRRIDLAQKLVTSKKNGVERLWRYEKLISTLPLPALLGCIENLPACIAAHKERLKWSSWRYLDLALSAAPPRATQWLYVADVQYPFFRVGCSSYACPAMAPPGEATLCVELSRREGELDLDQIARQLCELGMLGAPQDIKFCRERRIEYAYVHFDHHFARARSEIMAWLRSKGVQSVGRYGGWDYGSMEDAMQDGEEAARRCALN